MNPPGFWGTVRDYDWLPAGCGSLQPMLSPLLDIETILLPGKIYSVLYLNEKSQISCIPSPFLIPAGNMKIKEHSVLLLRKQWHLFPLGTDIKER